MIIMALHRKFGSSVAGHNRCAMASVRRVVSPNGAHSLTKAEAPTRHAVAMAVAVARHAV